MGKAYVFSDIHGELGLFKQIQEYMQEDDICYILGDCLDRGKHGITIIKEIMIDKRFKMLKGNHEQVFLEQLEDVEEGFMDFHIYFQLGGLPTWEEWCMLSQQEQIEIRSFLYLLPLRFDYKDKILTHAGFHPGVSIECERILLWDRTHLDITVPMSGDKMIIHGHTPTSYIEDGCTGVLQYHEKKICVDCGTYLKKRVGLLDLDSLEVIYFEEV